MSAGSNYRLSLFKIKSQATSHMALTSKLLALQHIHLWRRLTKGHSIKKANLFYPLIHKRFQIFHDLSHFLKTEKKAGQRVSLQKVVVLILSINSMVGSNLDHYAMYTRLCTALYCIPSVNIKIVSFWSEMQVKLRSDRLFDLSLQMLLQKADGN